MAIRFNNGVTNEYAYFDGSNILTANPTGNPWGFCGWLYLDGSASTYYWPATIASDRTNASAAYKGFAVNNNNKWANYSYGSGFVDGPATGAEWMFMCYRALDNSTPGQYWFGYGTSTTITTVASFTSGTVALNDVILGARPGLGTYTPIRIAHFRVWAGYAPTQAEFEAEMVSTTAVKTAPATGSLYAAYEFANDSGTYLNDSSGNARHLTGVNIDFATNYIDGPLTGGASAVAGISRHYARMMTG